MKLDMELRSVKRYGKEVLEYIPYEDYRREHCMCLNCTKLKPGEKDNCPAAQAFYEICKEHGCAFILTRCGAGFVQKLPEDK